MLRRKGDVIHAIVSIVIIVLQAYLANTTNETRNELDIVQQRISNVRQSVNEVCQP